MLLADQDPGALRVTAQQVRELGHTPTEIAVSVSEAAESIARDDPDLTIVVIYGDDEPALDLIEEIDAFASGPVIALLDREDSQFVAQAAERGIFAYARQQTADSIQSAIEIAMRRWREQRELTEQVERLENALERRAVIERAKGILMERHNLDDRAAFQRCASTPAAPTARWSTWRRRWPRATRCCPRAAIRSISARPARGTHGQPNPGVRRGPFPGKRSTQ